MKKLLFLLLFALISCGNIVPKCDEESTVRTVKMIVFKYDVIDDILRGMYSDDEVNDGAENDKVSKTTSELHGYLDSYINGDFTSIPKDMFDIIENSLKSYPLVNIRTNSVDETSKSCNCTVQYETRKFDINYTAQRNSDGEIYVEVER